MSDKTDTPITDQNTFQAHEWPHATSHAHHVVSIEIARDLERQLAEAMAELSEWNTLKSWGGTAGIIDDFIKGQQTRIHAAQHAEEQRDRLAEALRCCLDQSWNGPLADNWREVADAALAALNQQEWREG